MACGSAYLLHQPVAVPACVSSSDRGWSVLAELVLSSLLTIAAARLLANDVAVCIAITLFCVACIDCCSNRYFNGKPVDTMNKAKQISFHILLEGINLFLLQCFTFFQIRAYIDLHSKGNYLLAALNLLTFATLLTTIIKHACDVVKMKLEGYITDWLQSRLQCLNVRCKYTLSSVLVLVQGRCNRKECSTSDGQSVV